MTIWKEWSQALPAADDRQTQEVPAVRAGAGGRVVCLAALTGPNKGEVIEVADTILIGRDQDADFRSDDQGISRRHVQISVDGELALRVQDLESSNGTFVRGAAIRAAVLVEGDQFTIGESTFLVFSAAGELEDLQLTRAGGDNIRDQLTGLFNRRFFIQRLQSELEIARRRRLPLCVALFELDRFDELQRIHGREVAEECLVAAARRIAASVRTEDVNARYDRHRFAVQLSSLRASTCQRIVSRVVHSTATSCPVRGAPELTLQLTAGVAALHGEERTAGQLMHRAEAALLQVGAERSGIGARAQWQRTTL